MFYVKNSIKPGQMILKIYRGKDLKYYDLEMRIYQKLNHMHMQGHGFPYVISNLRNAEQAEILMSALGPSVGKLLDEIPGGMFSKATVFKIAMQLTQRLKALHTIGHVHGDLKMDNFLVGYNDPETVYLIDFGISQPFLDENGQHIPWKKTNTFSGNFMFASANTCEGIVKSRRDDIESLVYIVIYLLTGQLPWDDFEDRFDENDFSGMLRERLKPVYLEKLFEVVPPSLKHLFI